MTFTLIVDEALLRTIDPRHVRRLLESLGWHWVDRLGEATIAMEKAGEAAAGRILLPLNSNMRGYVGQLRDVFAQVAESEALTTLELIRLLDSIDMDVHLVAVNAGSTRGRIRVEDMELSVEGIKGWALSAATTEAIPEPRLIHPTRRPDRALGFLRSVEVAPTRPGSYVFPVHIVLPPVLGQQDLPLSVAPTARPFQRAVSERMYTAAAAALSASAEMRIPQAGVEAFRERADQGITANLLESLAKIGGDEEPSPYRLSTVWSPQRPHVKSPELLVSAEDVEVFRDAARRIREETPEEDVAFSGNVTRLHRETRSGPGEVTVAGVVVDDPEERFRRVTFELVDEDYGRATRAHELGLGVRVVGNLRRSGSRYRIVAAHDFTVSAEPPD
jgi:hypothetical protein